MKVKRGDVDEEKYILIWYIKVIQSNTDIHAFSKRFKFHLIKLKYS